MILFTTGPKLTTRSWREIYYPPAATRGKVKKIDAGWPLRPAKYLVAGKDFQEPSLKSLRWFDRITDNIMGLITKQSATDPKYKDELYDYNQALFLKHVNAWNRFGDLNEGRDAMRPARFDRFLSYVSIRESYLSPISACFGNPNFISTIETSFEPS
jgi:hypothetical protein